MASYVGSLGSSPCSITGATSGPTSGSTSSATSVNNHCVSTPCGFIRWISRFFALLDHCVSSPCGLITAVPRWISFSALRFTPDLGWETLSPKPQARDWGLSVTAFHHHVASSLRLPTCCPLLRWRPCAARFCDGAHVLPVSATAPTCRPLLSLRRWRLMPPARSEAPTCRPLLWRRTMENSQS